MSRRYPELTDGGPDCAAKAGQKFGPPQADLLGHDWLVSLYRGDAMTQVGQPGPVYGCRDTLLDETEPCRGRPGLIELVLQAELAHSLRQ